MEPVTKDYTFTALDGSKKSLKDLFADKSQLIVYHFMMSPTQDVGCAGCSFTAEHFPDVRHLRARDTAFTAVSRAPTANIEAYKKRTGWEFPWVCPSSDRSFTLEQTRRLSDALSGHSLAPAQLQIPFFKVISNPSG